MPTYSEAVRNGILNSIEATIGPNPILRLRTGAPPASLANPSTGLILTSAVGPTDWMADAVAGSKGLTAALQDSSADAEGNAGHYELCSSAGVPHQRGTVSNEAGTGEIKLLNVSIAVGQSVTVSSLNLSLPA